MTPVTSLTIGSGGVFRPTKIRQYAAFMEARGYAQADIFADSKIDPAAFNEPSYLVDFSQYRAMVTNVIRLTGNQGIGLEVGAETELIDFGIVGYAMMTSKTARDAVELWIRYSNALVGLLLTLRLNEHEDGSWSLDIVETRPIGFLYNFCVEEILMMAVRLGAALTHVPITPALVELSYPEPKHHHRYEELLNCKLRFNSLRTRMLFTQPRLDQKVKGADDEFNAICTRYCARLMQQIEADSPLVSKVYNIFFSSMNEIPTLDQLAHQLAMSKRTLRRRLEAENRSYKSLLNEFRLDLAKEYLYTSRLTAKETGHLLGFTDTNAFRRAFKSWTGKTVHAFQEKGDLT